MLLSQGNTISPDGDAPFLLPSDDDLIVLLERVSAAEEERRALLLDDAKAFGAMMRRRETTARLGEIAGRLLERRPASCLLTYAAALAHARAGRSDAARSLVAATRRAIAAGPGRAADKDRRARRVLRILQVVDVIDFEEKTEDEAAAQDPLENESVVESGEDEDLLLERLLRARRMSQYLGLCRRRFEAASTLRGQVKAVRDMLRQSLRPIPSYRPAYEQAAEHLEIVWPQLEKTLRAIEREGAPVSLWRNVDHRLKALFSAPARLVGVMPLAYAFEIVCKLGQSERARRLGEGLSRFAERRAGRFAAWPIFALLVKHDPDGWTERTRAMVARRWRQPRLAMELSFFFDWAGRVGEYERARQVHAHLPDRLKYGGVSHGFAAILQRLGRPHEARALVETLAARRFSRPLDMCPAAHWRAMTRVGELDFCARAHDLLRSVPQPKNPVGVVLTAPRTINLSTLLPLASLVEMKRRGWAVIPLVEGVLPLDPTGRPEIDQFLGSCAPTGRLSSDAARLRPIGPIEVDVPAGRLRWGEMNLDLALWEASAIKQRRYKVNFDCPALGMMMRRLAQWTHVTLTVLENARRELGDAGLKVATLVSFQARLPEAAVRAYCETCGDAERFFCLHAANGYQNYFSNFAAQFSTRMALANMTAEPERRTASFPSPQAFESYYALWRAEEVGIKRERERQRIAPRPARARSRAAEAVVRRIEEWRADGGKVVGLFGKVVCDFALPRHGGPAHRDMRDWINHSVEILANSRVLLVVKPHPHERRNEIGAFLTERFEDLIERSNPNVLILEHDWLGLAEFARLIDLGLVYNGTTLVELALLGVPAIGCSHCAPIDYPIGQAVPDDRGHYERMLRFEEPARTAPDLAERAAAWLECVRGDHHVRRYRYHSRPVTNRAVTPPIWFAEDVERYLREGDREIEILVERAFALPSSPQDQIARPQFDHVAT